MDLAERWGEVDRSHRKLAHRGSYTETVWVSPSTVRRVLAAHGLVLPERGPREPVGRRPWPDWLVWAPNRIWGWDVTPFARARRCAFAIIDMVSCKWIDTLVSVEETSTQVKVIFEQALTKEGLVDLITPERLELAADDPRRPILLAVSDIQDESDLKSSLSSAGGVRLGGDRCPRVIAGFRSERIATPCLLGARRVGAPPGGERPVGNSVTDNSSDPCW